MDFRTLLGDDVILAIFAVAAFWFGACIASFLNVCIWRLPRGESVVSPPSHCPKCDTAIRWWQNIPIISWCALRGKCANCHEPISLRYTIVELLGGVLFLLAFAQWALPEIMGTVPFANPWMILAEWLVITGLILGSFIDLEHYYLPDRVTLGGIVLGIPLSYLLPELQNVTKPLEALYWSLGGAAFGFLFLWGIGFLFSKLFKKEALGFGDVKLLGAVGAFFGPVAVLMTIILSSLVGAVVGVLLIARGKAKLGGFTAVPYGPFIATATLVWMYWGPAIVQAYLNFTVGK